MPLIYLIILLSHLIWTIILGVIPDHGFPSNYYYNLSSAVFFALPLLYALLQYRRYPGERRVLIPWIACFTLLVIAQAIWSYYNFFTKTNAPYPGIGDLFWLSYYPLQIVIILNLSKSYKFMWNSFDIITFFILANIFTIFSTFFLLSNLDLSQPLLVTLLNFAYPTLDALLAAFGVTILRTQSYTRNKYVPFLVLGYLLTSLGDALFAFTNNSQTYWNGNYVDFIFVLAHFLIALAVYYLPQSESQTV